VDRLLRPLTIVTAARGARRGLARGFVACLLCLALLSVGCSRPQLQNTFESDEALAQAVLDGLAVQNREVLLNLAVTRDEFAHIVWPTLPVSRPEVGMPMDFVWQDTFTKSRAYLGQTLDEFGGKQYQLVRVEFQGKTTDHGTHTISRETRLVVRNAENQELTLRLFGSIIRQDGRSKVYSYIRD
jgi:hypothetical protein